MEKTIYFRAFEPDDANLIYQWKNDDSLNKLTVGLNRKVCFEDAQQWIKTRKYHNPYEVYRAICAKDTNRMIGYACLTDIHFINSSANTGAIVIGDSQYNDGIAWIETVLFMLEYTFERLNLNRLYGMSLVGHKMSNLMEKLVYMQQEGVLRQAAFKNGKFYDVSFAGILKEEYFMHKENGDYEIFSLIKRIKKLKE